jgi:hypothetical protein
MIFSATPCRGGKFCKDSSWPYPPVGEGKLNPYEICGGKPRASTAPASDFAEFACAKGENLLEIYWKRRKI